MALDFKQVVVVVVQQDEDLEESGIVNEFDGLIRFDYQVETAVADYLFAIFTLALTFWVFLALQEIKFSKIKVLHY